MVFFSISFAWVVNDRINNFPKIRRFHALFALLQLIHKSKYNKEKRERLKSDAIVLWTSWPIIVVSLIVSIHALRLYYDSFCALLYSHIYVIPILFFIVPQFISRLISSVVLGLDKDGIKYMWTHDRDVFSIFTHAWKQENGLTCEGIKNEEFVKKGKKRTIYSFISLIVIYGAIYLLIVFKIF